MECATCGAAVPRLWTTHELCDGCYESLPSMSVNKAEKFRRCPFTHFTWPRGDDRAESVKVRDRKARGSLYHLALGVWSTDLRDDIEAAAKFVGLEDADTVRALKDLAGRFPLPLRNQILYADGCGGQPYPMAFRAKPMPGRPWLDGSFALIVSGPGHRDDGDIYDYLWIGEHDFAWFTDDRWLHVVDWKGGKEIDMSIMAPAYALAALRIWRRLQPLGVTVQTVGVTAPWSSPIHRYPVEDLPELESIVLDLSRQYHASKERGDWPATANEYCDACPRLSRCPEINGSVAVEPRPGALLSVTLEEASTPIVLEERERWPSRVKEVEAFGAALNAEAIRRLAEEGTGLDGDDDGDVRALRYLDRVAKVYQHPNGGYMHDDRFLVQVAADFGIDPEAFKRCEVAPILTHANAQETWQALDTLCQSLGIKTAHATQVTLDQRGLMEAILEAAVKVRKKAPTERLLNAKAQKINPSPRVSFSAFDSKKHALVPRCDEPAAPIIERPTCGAAAYLGDETGADEEERERRQIPPPQGEG